MHPNRGHQGRDMNYNINKLFLIWSEADLFHVSLPEWAKWNRNITSRIQKYKLASEYTWINKGIHLQSKVFTWILVIGVQEVKWTCSTNWFLGHTSVYTSQNVVIEYNSIFKNNCFLNTKYHQKCFGYLLDVETARACKQFDFDDWKVVSNWLIHSQPKWNRKSRVKIYKVQKYLHYKVVSIQN